MRRPECQHCQTCGLRKYQFWIDKQMHDRGCPQGSPTPQACADAREHAKLLAWARDNGATVKPEGHAFLLMFPEYAVSASVDGSPKGGDALAAPSRSDESAVRP